MKELNILGPTQRYIPHEPRRSVSQLHKYLKLSLSINTAINLYRARIRRFIVRSRDYIVVYFLLDNTHATISTRFSKE